MSLPAKKSPELAELEAVPGAPVPDEEIVERVLRGDHASFELIMRRYNQRLFRVARSIIGEDSEAEDIVQEAYFRGYQHLGQFEGRSLFSTWLTKIAVHEATARRRKQRRLRLMSSANQKSTPWNCIRKTETRPTRRVKRSLSMCLLGLSMRCRMSCALLSR